MNDQDLINFLQTSGHVTEEKINLWHETAALMAIFDAIGRSGASAVIKVDGQRPEAMYTIVLSGSPLDELFFRKDGTDISLLLREAIEFYKSKVWSK